VKGTYTVNATVTDNNGAKAFKTASITISPLTLTASFAFSPTNPTVGQMVTFTASVSGGTQPYSFNWSLGDGSSSTTNPTSHAYSSKGTFTISLTVTDMNGRVVTPPSQSITVMPLALTTDFSFTPASPVTSGQVVTFTAATTGGTTPYTYAWSFGDGQVGTGNPVMHAYSVTTMTTFTVTENVTDFNGVRVQATHPITVVPRGVTLIINFGPTTTIAGNTTFVSTISQGTPPYTCSWSFGDGTPTQTGCTAAHVYVASGTFSATLTVTDSANPANTNSLSQTITVEPNPSFIHGKIHWTHHQAVNTPETFTAKVGNPTTFTTTVTVTINVFQDTGVFVTQLTASVTLAPGASDLTLTLSFTPTVTGGYHFTGTTTYSATIPASPVSGTTTVTGTGNSKSGSFSVV
jgi:PKD repeat protein